MAQYASDWLNPVWSEAADQTLKQQELHVYLILCRPKWQEAVSFFCRGTIPRTLSTLRRKGHLLLQSVEDMLPGLQLPIESPQYCRVNDGEYEVQRGSISLSCPCMLFL